MNIVLKPGWFDSNLAWLSQWNPSFGRLGQLTGSTAGSLPNRLSWSPTWPVQQWTCWLCRAWIKLATLDGGRKDGKTNFKFVFLFLFFPQCLYYSSKPIKETQLSHISSQLSHCICVRSWSWRSWWRGGAMGYPLWLRFSLSHMILPCIVVVTSVFLL